MSKKTASPLSGILGTLWPFGKRRWEQMAEEEPVPEANQATNLPQQEASPPAQPQQAQAPRAQVDQAVDEDDHTDMTEFTFGTEGSAVSVGLKLNTLRGYGIGAEDAVTEEMDAPWLGDADEDEVLALGGD
jgi:hypothetical protein